MGSKPTKALNNVFCVARLEAAKYNEKLKSREGAAELLGYASASTISDLDLGEHTIYKLTKLMAFTIDITSGRFPGCFVKAIGCLLLIE